jgi:hypothetical protein
MVKFPVDTRNFLPGNIERVPAPDDAPEVGLEL